MSISSAFKAAVVSELADMNSGIGSFFSGEHAQTHGVHDHGGNEAEKAGHGMENANGQVISDAIQINGQTHYEVAFNDQNGQTHTEMVPAGDMSPRRGDEVEVSWKDGQAEMKEPEREIER